SLKRFVLEVQLLLLKPGFGDLSRDEVPLGNVKLFLFGVSRKPDHFHAVTKRGRDGRKGIRGCNEKHFRKVKRQIEIVVPERKVLGRVENLEQSRSRISSEVHAELIHLIQHHHRI